MINMSSIDKINYFIRPNKNIERKIIFECLSRFSNIFNLSDYRYIGFGAFTFSDFILAHKNLNISDLISIEKKACFERRVNFNKPYKCIDIKIGEANIVLPELKLQDKESILWLDYDGTVDTSVVSDVRYTCENIKTNSFVIFTINAHRGSITDTQGPNETPRDALERGLRSIFKDLVPSILEGSDLQNSGFPKLLSRMMISLINRSIRKSGRIDKFIPLFNFSYQDDSPMITIGGLVCEDIVFSKIDESYIYNSHITGENQFKIDVPPLTTKEKLSIDSILPASWPLSKEDISDIPFEIKESQLKAFFEFYKHYPVFMEGNI